MARRKVSLSPSEIQTVETKYGSARGFSHPHHVAAYENKLEDGPSKLPLEDRLTCRSCKTFAPKEHIIEHASNPDTVSMQKQRAAKNTSKRNISDAQFTLTYDEEK